MMMMMMMMMINIQLGLHGPGAERPEAAGRQAEQHQQLQHPPATIPGSRYWLVRWELQIFSAQDFFNF